MIILDTNILSEIYKPQPDPQVVAWYAATNAERIYLTAPTVAELTYGIGLLPDSRRKQAMRDALDRVLFDDFAEALLPFDTPCAIATGSMRAAARNAGWTLGEYDLMIAATAQVHGATLATRNIRDFQHLGIPLQNPFEGPAP